MLEFHFDDDFDDICNRAVGTGLGNPILESNAVYLDGNSRIEVSPRTALHQSFKESMFFYM